uniref:Uncharacterized protein n=1 Tax=Anguilla anguilla TaxID=7936 RepID=A0A0E9RPR8_ANGAN
MFTQQPNSCRIYLSSVFLSPPFIYCTPES